MPRARSYNGRRRGMGRIGSPAQLLDSRLALRVEPGRITPASRIVNGTARYTDPLKSGTPRQLQPKYGLTFNGTNEHAELNGFATPTGSFIVSLWHKGNAIPPNDGGIIGKWKASDNQRSFLISIDGITGHLLAYQSADGTASIDRIVESDFGDGVWRHITVVFSAELGFPTIYVDGAAAVMAGSGTAVGNIYDSPAPLEIGRFTKSYVYASSCSVDDVRIFDTALPESEIKALAAMKPGSTSGVTVSAVPLIHYKCEDPVTSGIVRNSGSLGSAADATITGTIANVRGTVSPVFCWANEVGGNHAWTSDGVDDYLNTQITLNAATAFTVWKRVRYLSTTLYDLDGFYVTSSTQRVRIGRGSANNQLFVSYPSADVQPGTALPINTVHTLALTAASGGNYEALVNGLSVATASAGTFTIANTTETFLIGTSDNQGTPTHHGHAEYYEYLIADRVLTDDELTWLETGGASGTAIDFANDPNILLYTDFQEQTDTQITNLANPNLPILKAVGGEMTMVPRDESNTAYDVNGKALTYVGQCPRDMVLASPAVTLNGTSEYITLPVTLAGATSWEFSCRIKTTDTAGVIFDNRDGNTDGYAITLVAGAVVVASDAADVTGSTIDDDAWHTLRVVWDGADATIHIDDEVDVTGALAAASGIARTTSYIGADWTAAAGFLAGTIADVVVTIDGEVVSNNPCCEPSGDIAFDISGNGNDGKLTGTIATMRGGTQNNSDVLVKSGYSVGRWYDGVNDSWSRATLVGGATRLCVSGWLVTDALGSTQVIVGEYKAVGSNDRSFLVVIEPDGKLRWTQSANGLTIAKYATNSVVITAGRLHHFAFTFDGASAAWEVDGLPVAGTWDNPVPTSLYAGASDFVIADYDDATGAPFSGTLSQLVVHKDPTTVWSTATKAAIRAAGKPSEIQAIVSGLGGTAWYFPYGDGSYEALQSLPALTHNGASEQRIIPVGAAGIQPTHGPGLLAPGQSLDLYCGQDDAPICQVLAGDLSDGTYDFGDGDEADALYKRGDANGEEIAVITPAATGAEQTVLNAWST